MSADAHNTLAGRLIREMAAGVDNDRAALNVLAESLLVGVGMLNFPHNPRAQAEIIQAIADCAQDRVVELGKGAAA